MGKLTIYFDVGLSFYVHYTYYEWYDRVDILTAKNFPTSQLSPTYCATYRPLHR